MTCPECGKAMTKTTIRVWDSDKQEWVEETYWICHNGQCPNYG